MSRSWSWETVDAEWSVELDPRTGVLRWRGVDKPRKGVPDSALSGGEVDQRVGDLLSTGKPSYSCPPAILAEVMSAARAVVPTRVTVPPLKSESIAVVLPICQAVLRKLTGEAGDLAVTQRQVSVEEVPDDRPTQSSGTRYVTEIRLGDRALFECIEEVGGFFQGSANWSTADFAGTGRLRLHFGTDGVDIEGAPAVVELFATLLRSS